MALYVQMTIVLDYDSVHTKYNILIFYSLYKTCTSVVMKTKLTLGKHFEPGLVDFMAKV